MNMLATQNCNVFLPLWVVPSFCPPSAPWHNQPQQWAETPSCSREFGGLQASLSFHSKLGGKQELGVPWMISVLLPVHRFKHQNCQSWLSYSLWILKEYINTDSGHTARGRFAAGWMRCRLGSGSCADLIHRVRHLDISPPSQISQVSSSHLRREDDIDSLPFFLPYFWVIMFLFNCLWREQQACF